MGVKVFGYTPYIVTTGSMTPKYPVGSVVYVKEIDCHSLEEGNDITFLLTNKKTIATHRIKNIDLKQEKIITYGIHNKDEEGNYLIDTEPVTFDRVIGKVNYSIPYLGNIYQVISTPQAKMILIFTVLILMSIMQIVNHKNDNLEEEEKYEGKQK